MKLTVLIDNNSIIDRYYLAEPALSFYIETEGKRILFDAGYSDAYISNAKKMGIDLTKLDYVVLSHGHLDHTWGLNPLVKLLARTKRKKLPVLVTHPLTFKSKVDSNDENIGSKLTEVQLSKYFELKLSAQPVWLTKKLVFLGEVPRKCSFEGKNPIDHDDLHDDSALAYKAKKGLVIITGCSHSGICNIAEQAKKVGKIKRVSNIIGGLHLLEPDKKQLSGTQSYLKGLGLSHLYACHCTDLRSKIALSKVAKIEEVGVGLVVEGK